MSSIQLIWFLISTSCLFQQTNPNTLSHDHNLSSYIVPDLSSTILNESIPTPALPIQDQIVDSSIQFSPKSILPVSSTLSGSQPSEIQTNQNKNEDHLSIEKPELDDDEANKVAIEDDKRRRNTLASGSSFLSSSRSLFLSINPKNELISSKILVTLLPKNWFWFGLVWLDDLISSI